MKPNENYFDMLVLGGGISGLSFARRAADEGRHVLLIEAENRVGGCIYTRRFDDGFWYELGAHTLYNSYAGLLDIVQSAHLADKIVQRGPARARFGLLSGGTLDILTPPKVLWKLSWFEAAFRFPIGIFRSKQGKTLSEYYGGLLGPQNFSRVLSPFFAAVPSQNADGFPAEGPGSLFKKRDRNKAFPRSYGFENGLQSVCDGVVGNQNLTIRTGASALRLRNAGNGLEVELADGEKILSANVAVALPVAAASQVLEEGFPKLAEALRCIRTVSVESVGVRIAANRSPLPPCAFVVPSDDIFFSAVTRDPFPHPDSRGVAFHFRPGHTRAEKLGRICEVLNVSSEDLESVTENRITLPAPMRAHAENVQAIERALATTPLFLTGNYFAGLAVEDCIARSNSEWERFTSKNPKSRGG